MGLRREALGILAAAPGHDHSDRSLAEEPGADASAPGRLAGIQALRSSTLVSVTVQHMYTYIYIYIFIYLCIYRPVYVYVAISMYRDIRTVPNAVERFANTC